VAAVSERTVLRTRVLVSTLSGPLACSRTAAGGGLVAGS